MLRCICCWVAVITRDANWDNPAILIIAKFIRTSGSETVSADLRSGRFAVTNFLNIYFVVDIKSNKFWWWRKKGRKKRRATHATEFYMWVIKKKQNCERVYRRLEKSSAVPFQIDTRQSSVTVAGGWISLRGPKTDWGRKSVFHLSTHMFRWTC